MPCLLAAQEKTLTSAQCGQLGGMVVDHERFAKACSTGKNLGAVTGLKCICDCCGGAEVQDCANHKIAIVKLCKKDDVLYYEFYPQSKLEVAAISLDLKGPQSVYPSGIELKDLKGAYQLKGGTKEVSGFSKKTYTSQPDLTRHNKLVGYVVRYRGAPRPCRFEDERSLGPCPNR
jgi:hypothetical protein